MKARPRLAALALALACGSAPATATPIDWEMLRPAVAAIEDPFTRLTDAHLDLLRELVRGRTLEDLGIAPGAAARQRQSEVLRELEALGVPVDSLRAQRAAIMEQRRAAAEAGVAALDGQAVELRGYLLPVRWQGDKATEFLLVPQRGACSHAAPPSPNQVVRVEPRSAMAVHGGYVRARVHGTLRLQPQTSTVFVVDGERVIASSYRLAEPRIDLDIDSQAFAPGDPTAPL
jgi:hypothetical protein